MQNVALILSLIAVAMGGYAVFDGPDTGGLETDDIRVKAMQEELAQLRDELFKLKNSGGSANLGPAQPQFEQESTDPTMAVEGAGAPMPAESGLGDPMVEMPTSEMPPPDPMLVAQIRQILREERQSNRDKRAGKHLDRFKRNLEERLNNNDATNGLSQEDRDALNELFIKERKSLGKLYRGLRSGDLSRKDARQELKDLRADTVSIVRESMGDDVANVVNDLSPLPRRGPLGPDSTER